MKMWQECFSEASTCNDDGNSWIKFDGGLCGSLKSTVNQKYWSEKSAYDASQNVDWPFIDFLCSSCHWLSADHWDCVHPYRTLRSEGETSGINGYSQDYAALPSSQHQTQVNDQTEAEQRQSQQFDPLIEPQLESQEEPHHQQEVPGHEPHSEPQGEPQGEPNEVIQDESNIWTRHISNPDRNISSLENVYGSDMAESVSVEEGGNIPSENTEEHSDRTDMHHPLLTEELGRHMEPEPGEHISFLPDSAGPFPFEGGHAEETFPENEIHSEHIPVTPYSDMVHDVSNGLSFQRLPTVRLPGEHSQGQLTNITTNENRTDEFGNNKDLSAKGDQQNQTANADVTTDNPVIYSSNSGVDEEQYKMKVNNSDSPHAIMPTPSHAEDISTQHTSHSYQLTLDLVTSTEPLELRTSIMRDIDLIVTQLSSSVTDLNGQSFYEVITPSFLASIYNSEGSTGKGYEMFTVVVSGSMDQSDHQQFSSSQQISPSASQGDLITSNITDQSYISHSIHQMNSVTSSPTVGSLPMASQGLVINDGQQNTELGSQQDTSTSPGYVLNSSLTTLNPYTNDKITTNSSTAPREGNYSIPQIRPLTSVMPLTKLSSQGTSATPSANKTPTSPVSGTTAHKTTPYFSEIIIPFLTTKKANHTSAKEQEKTSHATTVTNPSVVFTRSTVLPSTSTSSKVKNPSTSHKHIQVHTSLPSVLISIKLQMTLTEFCSQKERFITELMEIVENHQQIDIQQQQVVLLNIRPKMCDKLAVPFTDNNEFEEVKIELYFLDTDGKVDEEMTKVVSDIIKKGFDDLLESQFKQKLTDVKLIHPNEHMNQEPHGPPVVPKSKLETGITIVIVISSVGGLCCVCLLLLQIIIHRRHGKRMKSYPSRSALSNVPSMDSIALGVVPKSRPNSGLWNPGLELQNETSEPRNLLDFTALCSFAMDPESQEREFEALSVEMPKLSSVPVGAEIKNRFANVIPFPHNRIKLKKIPGEDNSDYINANYVSGYNNVYKTYIATQAPLHRTMSDFWRMVWEQQSRVILMLVPMQENGQPSCETYCPDTEGMDSCRQFGDITVELKKKDVQQEYTMSILQLKDIENNLIREIYHFWYTSWPRHSTPEPISLVKFILDTRPHFEDSGAPAIVHCSSGTGRTGTVIAIDICMRSFEDRRKLDVFSCVHNMRRERAGAVQTKEQYSLIYSALHEYAIILNGPKASITSTT